MVELLLKAQFNLVPEDILKNHGVHPVPLGKGSELTGLFIKGVHKKTKPPKSSKCSKSKRLGLGS